MNIMKLNFYNFWAKQDSILTGYFASKSMLVNQGNLHRTET